MSECEFLGTNLARAMGSPDLWEEVNRLKLSVTQIALPFFSVSKGG